MREHVNQHVIDYYANRLRKAMRKAREVERIKGHSNGNVYNLADRDKLLTHDQVKFP